MLKQDSVLKYCVPRVGEVKNERVLHAFCLFLNPVVEFHSWYCLLKSNGFLGCSLHRDSLTLSSWSARAFKAVADFEEGSESQQEGIWSQIHTTPEEEKQVPHTDTCQFPKLHSSTVQCSLDSTRRSRASGTRCPRRLSLD